MGMKIAKQYKAEMSSAIETLLKTLKENPEIWSIRKEATRLLFDNGRYKEAAELVWSAPEIPAVDLEIAFSARVLSRAQPRRAIRLLKHVQEKASGSPAKLLAIANALIHYGMVMQASRFYGAATACDPGLANGDLEHFMLWLDDSQRLWGEWAKEEQCMDELPWVKRDEEKGLDVEKAMLGLTTPIKVPGLKESTAEHLVNEYYRQVPIRGAEVTAPPAVTVPLDQLNPDDVIHDNALGATPAVSSTQIKTEVSEEKEEVPKEVEVNNTKEDDVIAVPSKVQGASVKLNCQVSSGAPKVPKLIIPPPGK
jgi:tetratricopeptide (TPR) repeat protein